MIQGVAVYALLALRCGQVKVLAVDGNGLARRVLSEVGRRVAEYAHPAGGIHLQAVGD